MLQKTDNRKNNFLVLLGEGPVYGINGSFGLPEEFTFNFSKANTKVCLSLHYNEDNSYLFLNEKEISKISYMR